MSALLSHVKPLTQEEIQRRWVSRYYQRWPGYRHVSNYLEYIRPRLEALRAPGLSNDAMAGQWQRNFRKALQLRITLKAGAVPAGRKWDDMYQTELYRDRRAIQDRVQNRIRFYGILTKELRSRFGYLVSDRNEF